MPAVKATDEEVWKMVAFVRRIGAGVAREKAAGDPAAGKLLFEGKGGCAACHAIGAEGGSLGPDLTNVARRRGLKAIEEAITTSVADGGSRYRAIQVVTSGGEQVSGIRLNEDDLSIQVRDDKGNLRSFLKQNLREVRRDVPPLMPSYGGILSGKEIGDLVAYLNSVGGVQ